MILPDFCVNFGRISRVGRQGAMAGQMDLIGELLEANCQIIRRVAGTSGEKWRAGGAELLDAVDMRNLAEEFGGVRDSEFDPARIRQRAWEGFQSGKVPVKVFIGRLARVVVFFPDSGVGPADVPLGLWSQIGAAFSKEGMAPIRIYLVASDSARRFPENGGKIGPENINGGYCYPCRKNLAVYVFRAEDATRVLIHELLHAFCTDRFEVGLDLVEARTEAWAELIWCCFMAQGDLEVAKDFFMKQVQWTLAQNRRVMDFIGEEDVGVRQFPWRYTVGKEGIFARWLMGTGAGAAGPAGALEAKTAAASRSLRLTSPYVVSSAVSKGLLKFETSVKMI